MKKKLLIASSLVGITGCIIFGSGYAVAPIASQIIRQNGFPDARISSVSLTPTGVMIDHIALDANEFSTIDNVNITVNWFDFIRHQNIQSVSVKDISLTCELDGNNQFKIAGWNAEYPKSASQSALLPVQSLLLEGVTLDIETPDGNIRVQGKLSVDTPTPNEQTLQYAAWGQQHQLSFDATGSGKLNSNGDVTLSTTLNDGRINLTHVELSRASGWIDFKKQHDQIVPSYSGQLVAGKINILDRLLQNVTVTLDTTKQESLFFKTSPAGHPDISFTGRWLTQDAASTLEFIVNSKTGAELIDLFAPEKSDTFKPWIQNANPVSLTLTAPSSALSADNKSASYILDMGDKKSDITLRSIGTAHYTPATSPDIDMDIDKTNITIAGGNITLSPFHISSGFTGKPPLDLTMTLDNIDMTTLAQLAEIDGLNAKGILNGTIPMTVTDKGVVFGAGSVQNKGNGTFSYTPASFPPSLQGDDERMQTVRQALSDFRFTRFSVDMSGDLNGKMKTTLKAEGVSPAFGDRPINLNLNLDGDLGGVIQQTLQAGDIGGKISDKIGKTVTGASKK